MRHKYKPLILRCILIVSLSQILHSQIINFPIDYPTIQQAINIASNGDTILVMPGTYFENISISSKILTIGSLFLTTGNNLYPDQTILDENSSGSVITVINSNLNLAGLTVTHGKAFIGGGMFADSSDISIDKCIFEYNVAIDHDFARGGAITCQQYDSTKTQNATITNTIFRNNSATYAAGAVIFISGLTDPSGLNILLDNCEFIDNKSGGNGNGRVGALRIKGENTIFQVTNCIFVGNEAERWSSSVQIKAYASGEFTNCLFYDNDSTYQHFGELYTSSVQMYDSVVNFNYCTFVFDMPEERIGLAVSGGGIATINNCIVFGNVPKLLYVHSWEGLPATLSLEYSNILGGLNSVNVDSLSVIHWLTGNIDSDPLFCDAENHFYTLAQNSPCIGTGENGNNIGAYGVGCAALFVDDNISNPNDFILHNNYPNPFNPNTKISYNLEKDSDVSISIFDISGKLIKTLQNTYQTQGEHSITWNGTDEIGNRIGAGMYFYQVKAGELMQTKKMVLVK